MQAIVEARTRELRDVEAFFATDGTADSRLKTIEVLLDIAERYIENLEGILRMFGAGVELRS